MRRFRCTALVSSLLLAAGIALTGATAAQASTAGGYVALGDSYASGVGAGSYISSSGDCDRSTKAYPYLWAAAHSPSSFSFMACLGATTTDVINDQLGTLSSSTSLVSINVGGNDAGFTSVMETCVLTSDSACLSKIATAEAYVDSTLPGNLDSVYSAISAKAPNAHVVVLGYPRLYKLGTSCLGLSETKRSTINGAADVLDAAVADRAAAHGFTFVDIRSAFSNNEICSSNAWLHSVNWLDITESYHPTADGHSGAYLPALTSAA